MPISAIGTAESSRGAVDGLGGVLGAPSTTPLRDAVPLPVPGRNGFTLVELLVTLFIIALMSAAVLAALPDPGGALTAEAERFAARARGAQERAVMDNRPISIRVDQAGYAFDWREGGEWRPIGRRPFDPQGWKQGTRAELDQGAARILFDSTGFAEAQRIVLARGRDRVAVEISNGGDVHVRP